MKKIRTLKLGKKKGVLIKKKVYLYLVGVVVAPVVWDDGGGAGVSCSGRVYSLDDPLPKISFLYGWMDGHMDGQT